MAATSTQSRTFVPDVEAVGERVREANDRLSEVGRKVSSAYLDGVENYVVGVARFERKLGEQSHIEAIGSLLEGHAKLTEDAAKTSIGAARELIAV
jgi:hypothetical protein